MVGIGRFLAPAGDRTNVRIGPAGPFTISSCITGRALPASQASPAVVRRRGSRPGSSAYTSAPS